MRDVTQILQDLEEGDTKAARKLLPLIYEDLRRLAAHKMANEAPGHTLQATALVHEAWLRLLKPAEVDRFQNGEHFIAAAAQAMRRILVESARRKKRLKHGGALERVALDDVEVALPARADEVIALDEALNRLAKVDARSAEVVQMRFFTGLTHEQIAEELGTSLRTVERLWKFARAWLFREVQRTRGAAAEQQSKSRADSGQ